MCLKGISAGFVESGSVLELGCGQGVLAERIRHLQFHYYCGVDFAENAIKQVTINGDPRFNFVASDIDDFKDDRFYDAIVFSESLYYLLNPMSTLSRYEKRLTLNGVFIISIYSIPKNNQLWDDLMLNYQCIDFTTVKNKSDMTWRIGVFKPAPSLPVQKSSSIGSGAFLL